VCTCVESEHEYEHERARRRWRARCCGGRAHAGLGLSTRLAGAALRLIVVGCLTRTSVLALLCFRGGACFFLFFFIHSFILLTLGALVLLLVGVRAGLGCRALQLELDLVLKFRVRAVLSYTRQTHWRDICAYLGLASSWASARARARARWAPCAARLQRT
jgi:hypothetical protein